MALIKITGQVQSHPIEDRFLCIEPYDTHFEKWEVYHGVYCGGILYFEFPDTTIGIEESELKKYFKPCPPRKGRYGVRACGYGGIEN